jgi:hypothetical protein
MNGFELIYPSKSDRSYEEMLKQAKIIWDDHFVGKQKNRANKVE